MQWTIPGTTLLGQREDADRVDSVFRALFLAGGLTLSQVSGIAGLEPYTVQNWVKRGFLQPPRGKRYDMEQVCRILNINLLKGALTLEQGCQLISYREPIPGAREKLERVLKVMLTAWLAGRLKAQAEQMLTELSI